MRATGASTRHRRFSIPAATTMTTAPAAASAVNSQASRIPRGRWRPAVRGLRASMTRSITRLAAMAQVRPPAMASVTQSTVAQPGQPPAASTMAM